MPVVGQTQGGLSRRAVGYALLAIIATAALLRIDAWLGTPVDTPLRADAARYYAAAHNLRFNGVYSTDLAALAGQRTPVPDAARNPGYPLFLMPFIGPVPTQSAVDRVVAAQVLISTSTVLFVYLLTARLLGRGWGLGAALLTALSPHLITANIYLLTETLFAFLLVLFAYVLARLGEPPRRSLLMIAGGLLGGAALVHPSAQHFILPWLLLLWLARPRALRWQATALALLGFALIFGPWVGRNLAAIGSTGDDQPIINTIHHGLYPEFMYNGRPESFGYPYRYDPHSPEIAADLPSVFAELYRRFTEEPWRHLHWFLVGKPIALWSWDTVQGAGDSFTYPVTDSPYYHHPGFQATHWLMRMLHWPLVTLGALGALLAWLPQTSQRWSPVHRLALRSVSLLVLFLTLVHIVGAPFPRYGTPLRPLLYLLAMVAPALLFARQKPTASSDQHVDWPAHMGSGHADDRRLV